MGRWKIHYYKHDQTEVTIEFKTEKQARRFCEKYVIRHPDEINPPDVYESEDDSDVEKEKLARIMKPLQASRKQRLRQLLIKWNQVYS
jgi:hypothetical protein